MVIPVEYPFNLKWRKAYLIMGSENRRMVCLCNSKSDRTTISYARYLLSVKLGRELRDDETAEHYGVAHATLSKAIKLRQTLKL